MRVRPVLLAAAVLAVPAPSAAADVTVPCGSDVPLGQATAQAGRASWRRW